MENTCSVDDCGRPTYRRGYCQTHYKRMLKTGDPGPAIHRREPAPEVCVVGDCGRPPAGRGYCNSHYARWRATGDPGPAELRHWEAAPEVCTVDGCEDAPHARGLCGTHHARWLKHGDPGSAELLHKPVGPCDQVGCDEPRYSAKYCVKHYRRWQRYGDPEIPHYRGWRSDDVGYKAVHSRLQAHRGRADAHDCLSCGKKARDWGYAYTDPYVQYDPKSGRPFSLDLKCYIPLCGSCHKRIDHRMARRQPHGIEGPPRPT